MAVFGVKSSSSSRERDLALLEMVASLGAFAAAMWWAVRMITDAQNPVTAHQRAIRRRLCEQLGIPPQMLNLDEHEYAHLSKVMLPQNITVTLQDVAGTDAVLDQLRRDIAFSCSVRPTSATSMLAGSKGLLLYGPPGTGKTMIASAFAREIGAVLINVRGSTLFSKWVGESERLTSALFSLAAKLSAADLTTILFVDEVDALLGDKAGSQEHETSRNLRTEFMQLWDGLLKCRRVLVVAATNQPDRLPDAIWRRFSSHLEVPLPEVDAREQILNKCLRKLRIELRQVSRDYDMVPSWWFDPNFKSSVSESAERLPECSAIASNSRLEPEQVQSFLKTEEHPLRRIAQLTPRYSGSDLVEVCKLAARHCVLEHVKCARHIDTPPVASAKTCNPSASLEGKGAVGPRKGAMSWSVLYEFMQWKAQPPSEDAEKCKVHKSEGAQDAEKIKTHEGEGAQDVEKRKVHEVEGAQETIEHNGDVFCDAKSTILEPKVSPQAQLSEAALIKCVSQVKAAANAVRKSYTRSGPQASDGPAELPSAETILKVLSALATQAQD